MWPHGNVCMCHVATCVRATWRMGVRIYVCGCWDLRLEKLSKSLSKIMNAAEGVESKHSTSWKHQEWMISASILGDPII